jgi:hypothetical protein
MGLKTKLLFVKLAWDVLFLAGCGAFVYGLGLAWRPLGFIMGGVVTAAGAFFQGYWASRRRS